MLCLHWDRQQGLVKPILPKFNSTELEGTVLFWVDILSKGIPMLPYLDGDNDMINNNVSAAAVRLVISLSVACGISEGHIKTEANFSLEVCFCFLYIIQI